LQLNVQNWIGLNNSILKGMRCAFKSVCHIWDTA